VDLTSHRPGDLPSRRSAEAFASWLREHPGVEVISRDCAGTYAEGGRLGAPRALQRADRWHLIRHLADAFEVILRRQAAFQKPSTKPPGTGSRSANQGLLPFA
jgi:transposase